MKGIFISYRRQDAAGNAGRLYDRLARHFGAERVFMDVEGIEPGLDFVETLEGAVASCEVLIVIIGAGWLATDNAGKRRLDDPKDFVRIETAAALARHIRVVPVLVDGAVMPRAEELPTDLAPLARRQAIELSNKHWDATSAELIRTLERVLDGDKAAGGGKAPIASPPPPASEEAPILVVHTRDVRRFWMIGGMLALVAAAVGVYLTLPWQEPATPAPKPESVAVAPPAVTTAPPASEKTAPTAEKPPTPTGEKPAVPSAEKASSLTAEKAAPLASEKSSPPPLEKAAPRPAEKPAPPMEKAASQPREKHPPPLVDKAAPRPAEKPATPPIAKSETSAPARAPEKTGAPEPSQTAQPSLPAAAAPAPAPPVTAAPVASTAALPAALPRVGDTWEYRMRSKWPTVEPRTYAHVVTAVSGREVAETMSVVASADGTPIRQAVTPDTRFVEWRGRGFYLLEFNPFLEAFGGLQSATAISGLPAMPAENPFHAGWSSRGRLRGSESVTVPAGSFQSLKVEIDSTRHPTESAGTRSHEPVRVLLTLWYAPEVKRTVKMVRVVFTDEGMHLDEDTYELVRYRVQ